MAALVRNRIVILPSVARVALRSISTTSVREAEGANVAKPTHTGQVWDANDYRRIRFMDKDKLVNTKFAIDLIADDPVVVVKGNHVFSDSGGALGHPKVYINLDKPEVGVCGYSGRKFIQAKYYDEAKHGRSITYEEYLKEVRPNGRAHSNNDWTRRLGFGTLLQRLDEAAWAAWVRDFITTTGRGGLGSGLYYNDWTRRLGFGTLLQRLDEAAWVRDFITTTGRGGLGSGLYYNNDWTRRLGFGTLLQRLDEAAWVRDFITTTTGRGGLGSGLYYNNDWTRRLGFGTLLQQRLDEAAWVRDFITTTTGRGGLGSGPYYNNVWTRRLAFGTLLQQRMDEAAW
ncbi:hypothetical protein BaRGS_00006439, partial [Batillaria attramentaria]